MGEVIWIVEGTTGEYSDVSTWAVCAFRDEALAKELAERLTSLGKVAYVGAQIDSRRSRRPKEWRDTEDGKELLSLDPAADISYTGLDYTAYSTELR